MLSGRSAADIGIVAPMVHLNGTSRAALTRDYQTAARALGQAIECVSDACPNGRDYYRHADPGAMGQAVREHEARIARLRAVQEELLALLDAVDEL